MAEGLASDQALQDKVNSMLRRGVVYSIIWLMGFGSLLAVVLGVRAMRIINRSDGKIEGTGKALWCIVVGLLGVSFWLFVVVMVIVNQSG